MLRQRMGGAGIRLHSTLLEAIAHDGEAGGAKEGRRSGPT